jgi:hypothetical protein
MIARVKQSIARLAGGTRFPFSKLRNFAGYASRIEESLGIESGLLRGLSFGSNAG